MDLVSAGQDDWGRLTDQAAELFGGGLHARREGKEIALLKPSAWGPASFDGARQTLIRPLKDARGKLLPLKITYEDHTKSGVSFLEQYAASGPSKVLGLIRMDSTGLFVEPVTIHEADKVINLTLEGSFPDLRANDRDLIKTEDGSSGHSGASPASSTATLNLGPSGESESVDPAEEAEGDEDDNGRFIQESTSPLGLLLSAIESELVSLGEKGLSGAGETKHLLSLAEKVGSIGLQACERSLKVAVERLIRFRGGAPESKRPAARSILRAHYVCRLAAAQEAVLRAFP